MIVAVKDNASLQLTIDSKCQFTSVLYDNVCTISSIVKKIKNAGKYAFAHVDLLEGASNKEVVIWPLKLVTEADGIINTKTSMLKAARAEGFFCVHRLFIAGSISFHNIDKQAAQSGPNCIKILPGCMPKVLGWVTEKICQPLVAGGLMYDEEDARNAISAGVVTFSTTSTRIWTLTKKLLWRNNRNKLNLA